MPGVRGGRPGPPDPGRSSGDGCREPSGRTAAGLLRAQRGTVGRRRYRTSRSHRRSGDGVDGDGELALGGVGLCPRRARPCKLRVGFCPWSGRDDGGILRGWLNTQHWQRAGGENGFLKHPSAAPGEAGSAVSHARAELRSVSSAGFAQSGAQPAALFFLIHPTGTQAVF